MLPRDRFLRAVSREEPDRVPLTDLCLDPPVIEAITGKRVPDISLLSPTGKNPRETSARTRKLMVEACLKLGFDAVAAISDYAVCGRNYRPRMVGVRRFVDEWGRIMEPRPEIGTTWYVGGTVTNQEEMAAYAPPDPEEQGAYEMIEEAVKGVAREDVAVMGQGHSGWHMAFQIRGGIDRLLIDMYRCPSTTRRFLGRIADSCHTIIRYMLEAGADSIFITDDYADNRTPFMNPKMFREFELPNIARVAHMARRQGVPLLKHTDGNVGPIMDQMIEAGIDGIHPLEPGAMDLAAGKDAYGDRLAIFGNVDCRFVLPMGSEADTRMDVRRCIQAAAPGGGYVLTSSNSIHANCKAQNVRAMYDEARRRGSYGP